LDKTGKLKIETNDTEKGFYDFPSPSSLENLKNGENITEKTSVIFNLFLN
jgi:hypothetical protein